MFNKKELFRQIHNHQEFDKVGYEDIVECEELLVVFQNFFDLKIEWNNLRFILQYWLSFLEMIELFLNAIYACGAGKWDLLFECIRQVILYTTILITQCT